MASVNATVDIVLPVIQRLRIEPGEVLVIKGMKFVQKSHRDDFRDQVKEMLPGVKVMMLPEEAELAVITPVRAPEVIPIESITYTTVDGKEETCQPTEHERMAEFFKRESSNGK